MVGACLGDTRAASRAKTMAKNCSRATSFIFHCVHATIVMYVSNRPKNTHTQNNSPSRLRHIHWLFPEMQVRKRLLILVLCNLASVLMCMNDRGVTNWPNKIEPWKAWKEIQNTRVRKVKKAWLVLLAQLAHKGYKVKMDRRGNKGKI